MPSYNKDKGAASGNRAVAQAKVLGHMGGRGIKFDSTTNKGIKGLGNPGAEGKYI